MDRLLRWTKGVVRELRRRRVIRVAVVYAGTAFVILQIGEILVEPFGLPGWTLRMVTFLLVLGFPLAVGLAWVFDVTEEGLVWTGAEKDASELGPGGKPFTSDAVIISLLVLIAAFVIYPRITGPAEEPSLEEVQGEPAAPEDTVTARLGPKSVAVLPFTYLAAEDSADYFSLGMTDELLTRLSQIEDLSVIARTSVMQYQETVKTIPEIARELRFQETGASLTTATRLLRRSIAIDSTFAPAWALLSFCAWFTPVAGGELPEGIDGDSLARAAARRALELDSTSAEAHIAMGVVQEVLDRSFPAAGPHFQRAVELNPGLANAHREYGLYLQRMGRFEAAEGYLRKAARLDPVSAVAIRDLGYNDLFRGNYKQAKRHLKKALALQPDLGNARAYLGLAYLGQDSVEAALRQMRRAVETRPSPWTLGGLGLAYAQAGRFDSTKAILARIQREFEAPFYEGILYVALGKPDRALDRLEQGGASMAPLKVHPVWEPLRGKPRFQRLLEEMGLDEATVQETMEKLSPEPPDVPTERSQEGSGGPT